MSEIEKLIVENIAKEDAVFDFEQLYKYIAKWLEDAGYMIVEPRNEEEGLKRKKKLIKWKCEKEISDYFKHVIKVKYTTDMKEVESKERKKLNKGKVKVALKGVLMYDWKEWWEDGHPGLKFLRDFYNKYMINDRINRYRENIKEEVNNLAGQIRNFLSMEKRG